MRSCLFGARSQHAVPWPVISHWSALKLLLSYSVWETSKRSWQNPDKQKPNGNTKSGGGKIQVTEQRCLKADFQPSLQQVIRLVMKGCQMQLKNYILAKQPFRGWEGMTWSSKRLYKKRCCLELFPLEHCLLWLPGVALQAYQIALFCIVLNIPKAILLDSGNSLTFKSLCPMEIFWNCLKF